MNLQRMVIKERIQLVNDIHQRLITERRLIMNNITNMTREEINKFSGVEPYCFETDREEDWYKMGCIDGLEAADAEPNIRRLWHNPSEEPQDDLELIIYKYKDNFWFTRKQNIIKCR